MPYVAQGVARLDHPNPAPHAFVCRLGQTFGKDGWFSDEVHSARITEPAFFDDGHIDVEDITVFKHLVTRNAMANLMVDRCADGAWKGGVAWRRVTNRG